MISKCCMSLKLIVFFLYVQGAVCFFVKHVETKKCVYVTNTEQTNEDWGSLTFVELSDNCLDAAAQFRFRNNSAMLSLERKGCLEGTQRSGSGGSRPTLYMLIATKASANCRDIEHAITQTPWGGLYAYYIPDTKSRCLALKNGRIDLTTNCGEEKNKYFHFGSVTCHGNMTENANCPPNQYMVIKSASYRRLPPTEKCGLSNDSDCEVDVTCRLKKQCDGQPQCSITVNDNLFSGDQCPGSTKYLYFEYQCNDTATLSKQICVDDVSLTHSTVPNEGFVKIETRYNGMKNVCWQSLTNETANIVCRQFGYTRTVSLQSKDPPSNQDAIFTGSIECTGEKSNLSQCTFTTFNQMCSKISYIKCHICDRPLLEDKQQFPDSTFTASAFSEGHNSSDARISSDSSWCAPDADGTHYLQVNFERPYVIYYFVIFGDATSPKWVTEYNLNYTDDRKNWEQVGSKKISGNKDAYNDAAIQNFTEGVATKALRFIPLSFKGQPCMRIEICGAIQFPDKPTDLNVTNIKSRSAEISWKDPDNTGDGDLTKFRIRLRKENSPIQNITQNKANEYELNTLKPDTAYTIYVSVRNQHGFGEETIKSFNTSEDAPEGSPLNVTLIAHNSSSLSVTWKPPKKDKRNGVIVSYTVCVSHENKTFLKNQTTNKKMLVIGSLKASTKYYVRVLASTKVGRGPYSENKGTFTNGKQPKEASNRTTDTLTFPFQNITRSFEYFYVVALELKDGKKSKQPPASYKNDEFATFTKAKQSTDPKSYIAAILTPKDENMFILGDGRNTSIPTLRRRRSTSSSYYNGPLESGTSYIIFQRIFINNKTYYSTDWSSPSTTDKMLTTTPTTPDSVTTTITTSSTPKITSSNQAATKNPAIRENDGNNNTGAIVGAVIGICVLLILIILAIIMFRRRKGKQDSHPGYQQQDEIDKRSGPPEMNDAFADSHDFEMKQRDNNLGDEEDNVDPPDDFYANKESIAARVHNPIPVEEFDDHVKHQRKNDNKEFNLDFEDLPTGRISNWDIAKRSFNIPKNRYGNAITYNHARVILSGDEKTDYINATFMNGLTENYYIATQGPKPKTVDDFWRMIFEHKCPTIVMLTTLKEMGKTKCEKYWPEESGMYGDIKVTTEQTKTFADYVTRVFIVEKDGEQREVKQFHFMSWPDYGVPQYPTQILTFRRHFKSFHESTTGPAVIHCSAGVGRTGVFITLDKILDDLDKEKKDTIDVFGFVKDMRTRRVNMVQTADQYVFIHDTLVDHLKCGANEVEATQITFEINKLLTKNKKGETGFEEKFKRLNAVTPQMVKEKCEAALLEQNKKKNRKADIYPSESDRPYLKHIENIENSDYINACYVDGYLGKSYFIATQTPLTETINDFWRMVLQHKSSTIVMLNQLREGNEEYPMFWPTQRAKPQSFGTSTIMLDSFVKKENIVVRKFVVSPSVDMKEGRMVRLIQYMSWPDHGVPTNVDDIVKILSEVEESQRAAEKKGPVTVICSNGAGRSGTYIAISNLVDRVKVVQVIDVFQCIRLIRTKRPQFVETVDQFKLCYDAVTSVLRSFDEYSNFTSEDPIYSN